MNRLASLLRSVLPADLTQLLFLGGLVCLTVAPHLRWTPATPDLAKLARQSEFDFRLLFAQVPPAWRVSISLAVWPMLLSALAGWWTALQPCPRPELRIVKWVLAPVAVSLVALCGVWLYLTTVPGSVLEPHSWLRRNPKELVVSLWAIGSGFHYCLLGTLLVVVFAGRLVAKKTSLPVALGERSASFADADSWRRTQTLVWAMLGPQTLVLSALSFVAFLALGRLPANSFASVNSRMASALELVALIAISAVAVGGERTKAAWRSVKVAKPDLAVLGVLLPVLLAAAMLVVGYASSRAEWAAREFGQYAPPTFLPENLRFDPWFLLLLVAAFAEEFVFRGILQPRFIERYGLYRGLALVGVIWGAFHFPGDRYSGLSDAGIFEWLLSRVATCVAMGFVLSWLTLRSGSLLPATLAHGVSNMVIYAGSFSDLRFGGLLRIAAWALLAYVLFRYWPPQTAPTPLADAAVEPAISAADAI